MREETTSNMSLLGKPWFMLDLYVIRRFYDERTADLRENEQGHVVFLPLIWRQNNASFFVFREMLIKLSCSYHC